MTLASAIHLYGVQYLIQMNEISLSFQQVDSRFAEGNYADGRVGQRIGDPAMVTVEDFSRLVAGIYAAAVTPAHWESALRGIHSTLGGTSGSLLMADGATRSIIGTTLPREAGKSYIEYYHRLDYVSAALERGPVGAVRTGSELMDVQNHREFHADWLRPHDADNGLLVRLTGGPRPTCFVVAGLRGIESFDTPEHVKLMSGLVAHLQQALRTQDKLAARERRHQHEQS